MACEETGEHCLPSPGPIVGYHFHQPWHIPRFDLLIGNISRMCVICPCIAKHLDCFGEPLMSVTGSSGYVAPEELNQKGHGKPVDLLVDRVRSLRTPTNHPYRDGMPITCCKTITYVLLADTRRWHSRQMR